MNTPALTESGSCDIAFKEWAGICQALEAGQQSIILRKGGIAEAQGRFTPEHARFWLFPTYTHQQAQGLRVVAPDEPTDPRIAITGLAEVVHVIRLENLAQVRALDCFHLWTPETLESRFRYRTPGLWLLTVRVYKRPEIFWLAQRPEFQGCHSWVPLPEPISMAGLVPVLSDVDHHAAITSIQQALDAIPPGASHE